MRTTAIQIPTMPIAVHNIQEPSAVAARRSPDGAPSLRVEAAI
jgi:hypothetical protein